MREEIKKRITDFWKGRLTKQDRHDLLRELQEKEEDIKATLGREFEKRNPPEDGLLSDREYRRVLEELHRHMVPINRNGSKVIQWKRGLVAAAMLMVGIGTAILAWRQQHLSDSTVTPTYTVQDTIHLFNDEEVDKQAVLADGSIVILSPGSTLSYPANYGTSYRELHLRGQGRFKVARDTVHPFVVWANGYTTTALGTEFTIDTRHADRLHIALLSGKIVVKSTSGALRPMTHQYLLPGDKLEIQTKSGVFALTKPKGKAKQPKPVQTPDRVAAQAVPVMEFDDTPLQTVFETIARRRGTPIYFEENLLTGRRFTGEFRDDESVQTIVGVICQMNNLTYTENSGHIHIQQKYIDTIEAIKQREIQIK